MTPDGKWVLGLIHNGESLPEKQLANLQFIVLAANLHDAMVEALSMACDDMDALVTTLDGVVAQMPITRIRLGLYRAIIARAKGISPDQCCEWDHDHDGNCPIHPRGRS
jgi:hypothetical protein